ncbi:GIY-YIG nuclease superfamily protein [Vibrio phage 1.161.O._10N.261.48.C5]|nr:GIY-YIG nuclease superfamily protein [Vibrio phage 1.161.O._10N.261.48.C5]
MFYIIYKITNKVNNKFYIGITSEGLERRFNGHCRKAKVGSTTNFHQALMKYGFENFTKEILHSFEENCKKTAYSIEQQYIDSTQAVKIGYNMDVGFGWNITDRSGENNPMFGKISGNVKRVVVYGKDYISATEAGKDLGLSSRTISQWALSNKEKDQHCYYI